MCFAHNVLHKICLVDPLQLGGFLKHSVIYGTYCSQCGPCGFGAFILVHMEKNGFCGGGVFKGGVKQVVRTIIYFKDTGMGVPPNYHNCSATSL